MALTQEQIANIVATVKGNYLEELNKQLTAGAQLSAAVFMAMINQQLALNNAMNAADQSSVLNAMRADDDMGPFMRANEDKIAEASLHTEEKQQDDHSLESVLFEIRHEINQQINAVTKEYQHKLVEAFKDNGVLNEGTSPEDKAIRAEQNAVLAGMDSEEGGGATVLTEDQMTFRNEMEKSLLSDVPELNHAQDNYSDLKRQNAANMIGPAVLLASLNSENIKPDEIQQITKNILSEYLQKQTHIYASGESKLKTHLTSASGNTLLERFKIYLALGEGTQLQKLHDMLGRKEVGAGLNVAGPAPIETPSHPFKR